VALGQSRLDEGQRARRHGTAVHPAEHACPLEDGEVASYGFGRDAELLGEGGDAEPAAVGDEGGDGLLTLLRIEHAVLHGPRGA
jgi:hypothetical protein